MLSRQLLLYRKGTLTMTLSQTAVQWGGRNIWAGLSRYALEGSRNSLACKASSTVGTARCTFLNVFLVCLKTNLVIQQDQKNIVNELLIHAVCLFSSCEEERWRGKHRREHNPPSIYHQHPLLFLPIRPLFPSP